MQCKDIYQRQSYHCHLFETARLETNVVLLQQMLACLAESLKLGFVHVVHTPQWPLQLLLHQNCCTLEHSRSKPSLHSAYPQ